MTERQRLLGFGFVQYIPTPRLDLVLFIIDYIPTYPPTRLSRDQRLQYEQC